MFILLTEFKEDSENILFYWDKSDTWLKLCSLHVDVLRNFIG